ncbi:unnamed protein product [Arabis nemorensis]|uniref:F-box associated beta-propeller type 3 domain-containing protein n=1 Tax=Arabis nemorensis TaxID=586526 RepID=A0A565CFE6_9BRAS|nr:unnamed protein product [Arabis nemorensis]
MEGYSVSHVFRGLMCFVNGPSAQIYNTTTRQLVVLPKIEESKIIPEDHKKKNIMYHIGHDSIHDQYKVICTVSRPDEVGKFITFLSEHWVLLLGGDESSRWRKISSPCLPHFPLTQGLTINGHMYYLAWVRLLYPVLVIFDISSEEISMLQEPEDGSVWSHYYTDVIEYGGRVALLHHSDLGDKGEMELWVLENEEKNEWSKETLVLHSSQMDMVKMHIVNDMSLKVRGTTRNGEVILVPQNTYRTQTGNIIAEPHNTIVFYVFLYNIQENHLRKVEIKESSNPYLTKLWDVIGLDDIENLMYL